MANPYRDMAARFRANAVLARLDAERKPADRKAFLTLADEWEEGATRMDELAVEFQDLYGGPIVTKTLCLKYWRHPVSRKWMSPIARWSETELVRRG